MNTKIYLELSARIIIICAVGFFGTYFGEALGPYFGDTITHCQPHMSDDNTGVVVEWGARHYWYTVACVGIVILSVATFVGRVISLANKHFK